MRNEKITNDTVFESLVELSKDKEGNNNIRFHENCSINHILRSNKKNKIITNQIFSQIGDDLVLIFEKDKQKG